MIPNQRAGLKFTPDGTSPNEHQCVKSIATLPHNLMSPFQMESHDCGPTAAPRPHLYEHRQARPGVSQAALYVLLFIQATLERSRL